MKTYIEAVDKAAQDARQYFADYDEVAKAVGFASRGSLDSVRTKGCGIEKAQLLAKAARWTEDECAEMEYLYILKELSKDAPGKAAAKVLEEVVAMAPKSRRTDIRTRLVAAW